MRYLAEEDRVLIDTTDLARILFPVGKSAGGLLPTPSLLLRLVDGASPCELFYRFPILDTEVTVALPIARADNDTVVRVVLLPSDAKTVPPLYERRARTEGLLSLFASGATTIETLYYATGSHFTLRTCETPTAETLAKCKARLSSLLAPPLSIFLDRARKRLPTMRAAKFPFPSVRRGQRDFIEAVNRTLVRGGSLFATAPTGTGKTVSVLYPAIRALGQGNAEKVFYLTPKSTTARAAADTCKMFFQSGVDLRALSVTAKEKICPRRGECRLPHSICKLLSSNGEREREAARALLAEGKPVIGEAEITAAAKEAGVCAYELTLAYAELADIVICDYNYLFDLDVYMRRFFDMGGEYAYLVDEAHTLAERAVDMYSAELSEGFFLDVLSQIDEKCNLYITLSAIKEEFRACLAPYLRDAVRAEENGEATRLAVEKQCPAFLLPLLTRAETALSSASHDKAFSFETRLSLARAAHTLISFLLCLTHYSEKYTCFLRERGERLSVKLVCLDPAEILAARTETGRSAVFFSATLTPIDYYRAVLGGDGMSAEILVPSPFTETQMAVAVMDTLSVRFRAREETLVNAADAIQRMADARLGNYMVFCPSFSYMESLSEVFRRRSPETRVILQKRHMTGTERDAFLSAFSEDPQETLVGFTVSGGIFGEGIDLAGTRLIGAAVVGVGMPPVTAEREAMREYYDERFEAGREFAYIYPGANRVLQAAGRVIRRTTDRGVILLIDDRFAEPVYKRLLSDSFQCIRYVGNGKALSHYFSQFWQEG